VWWAVLLVVLAAWAVVGFRLYRSGNRSKTQLLESLRGKRVTIRYSLARGMNKFTGVVGPIDKGFVTISNGVEDKAVAITMIRSIDADGIRLRRR